MSVPIEKKASYANFGKDWFNSLACNLEQTDRQTDRQTERTFACVYTVVHTLTVTATDNVVALVLLLNDLRNGGKVTSRVAEIRRFWVSRSVLGDETVKRVCMACFGPKIIYRI